jgi:hypothetical protein
MLVGDNESGTGGIHRGTSGLNCGDWRSDAMMSHGKFIY